MLPVETLVELGRELVWVFDSSTLDNLEIRYEIGNLPFNTVLRWLKYVCLDRKSSVLKYQYPFDPYTKKLHI